MMHRIIKLLVATTLCVLSSTMLHAQKTGVSGQVLDSSGTPLIAVTVYEKGNPSNGTATDANGKWALTLSSPKSSVTFTCLGYQDVTESVSGRSTINVTLKDDSVALEAAEVVSVGYGSVAKRDLTGSVSSVSMDKLTKSPVTNFDQALTGRVAGVVVTTGDGAVGSTANITIRGNNSLTQSSAPLYVIDGFLSESSLATSLNPSDIESIDILKDASATAIYGARGANGVVVIQTKQGVEGKPVVNFSSSWTMSEIANKIDLMGAYDFVALQTEIYESRGGTNVYLKDGHTLDEYVNAESIDWQDRIYRNSLTQNYSVSLSGGSKSAGNRYSISLSALDQDGIIVNSNFQKYQGKINFSQKIGKKLKFDILANYARSVTNGTTPTTAQQGSSASGWLIYSVWGYRPVMPLSQTGNDNWADDLTDSEFANANDYRFNPAKTVRNEYRKTILDYISTNASLSYTIIDGLVWKSSFGYTMLQRRREEFNGTETYTGYPGSPSGKGINGGIYWTDTRTWLNDNTLTYKKTLAKKHHVTGLLGFSLQGQNLSYQGVSATQMTTETLGLNGLNTGSYQVVTPYERDWRMMSAFARFNYDYKYKYYFTATMRADGSSKFPTANRWGYFPSASFAWNFNREDWLKNSSWLSNGKLRLSYGQTGNNRTSTPYDFYSQITTLPGNQNSYDYVINGQTVAGYYPSNMENSKLKWETTAQFDAGIDLGFFQNRIKVLADYYEKNTYDLLLQATQPASSGYTSAMVNIGSMRNRGFEFTLDVVPVKTNSFEWTSSFNIAFNRNKVTALTSGQRSLLTSISWEQKFNSQYPYITQVGKPTGLFYGYIYEGTYKPEDFTENGLLKDDVVYLSSVGKDKTVAGDAKYADLNEDGVIDDNDRTIIGAGQPLHTGGFTNTFNWKGFDLTVFMNWSYGNDILNANRLIFENAQSAGLNMLSSYKNRYSAQNTTSDIPRVMANGTNVYSSRVIEDGSFLRVKNITLGYTLPRSVLTKIHCGSLRVYLSLDNIFTLTNYSGPDPEVSTRSSVLTPGFDWSAYPRAKGVSGGLSCSF